MVSFRPSSGSTKLQKDTASLLVKKSPLPQSAFSAGSSRAASARSSFQMVSSL